MSNTCRPYQLSNTNTSCRPYQLRTQEQGVTIDNLHSQVRMIQI